MSPGDFLVAHLGPGGVPVPFTPGEVLEGWHVEPLLMVGILWIAMVYLVSWFRARSVRRGDLPRWRVWAFLVGLVLLVASVNGPLDRYGDVNVAVHMAQHVVLLYLVAPLLVLGAPLTVVRRGLHPRIRARWVDPILGSRAVLVLASPWVMAGVFVVALYATHFTGWYNAALTNQYIHDSEHFAYLITGFALWTVLVGFDSMPVRRPAGQRMVVVLALVPAMIIVAVIFIVASDPLYPYYVGLPAPWGGRAAALGSQQVAGAVMWLPSMLVTLGLLAWLTVEWFRDDEAAREAAVTSTDENTSSSGGTDVGEGPSVLQLVREAKQRRFVAPSSREVHRPR